ncbi:MAG: IS1634 family transposase [Burkholderiaceae bacterium]
MFVKLTKSGPRRYVQLAESFRDETGKVKQRTIASLGRVEQVQPHLDSIVRGLCRATGRAVPTDPAALPSPTSAKPDIRFEPSRALGDVWVLTALWKELGFERLEAVFRRRSRRQINVEAMLRVMVFNRLCDPESKLGVLRWLERVCLPGIEAEQIQHQHLLRAMDALIEQREQVDAVVAQLLRPLIDVELAVVFYDLTTIRAEGLSEQADDVREFGKSKDGGIRRQFVLGVVQTAQGLPIHHEVFAGNVAETKTLRATLETVMARFPIRRVIAVADRGLMSADNLQELAAITTPSGEPLEYILAVPGRRYGEFVDLLGPLHVRHFADATTETTAETVWERHRLVIAHDPVRAAEQTAKRDATIKALEDQAAQWVGKLDGQDAGERTRGRPLSDGGARAKFYHQVLEARLGQIIKVDLKSELFTYSINRKARKLAELMDGKLLLVTNVAELKAEEIVERYKSLADIERGFRVLKSEIEIGPVHHRLPDRIRAHASLCFIALILHRVMRMRLRQSAITVSPERALEHLRRIQQHEVYLGETLHRGVTTVSDEQRSLLASLGAPKPVGPEQLALL